MKSSKQINQRPKVDKDVKDLVRARLMTYSRDMRLSVGDSEYTREQLLKSVDEENEVGRQIMETEMEFLRDMAEGKFYNENLE